MAKVAKKATGDAQDRKSIIANLLAFTHDRVRYTGLEFGLQSLVPATPQETLKRRFGDCKDKSTLLIASSERWGSRPELPCS